MKIILASSSPRRKELLSLLGLPFSVEVPSYEEKQKKNEAIVTYVKRNAHGKGESVFKKMQDQGQRDFLIISADTVVVIGDLILEKPKDKKHALWMLRKLIGKTHNVLSAVSIFSNKNGKRSEKHFMVKTKVTLNVPSADILKQYVETKEPYDKSGAYAAQGMGSFLIQDIRGSYTNVVGLPLYEVVEALSKTFKVKLDLSNPQVFTK